MIWHLADRFHPSGAALADRHYNRQRPGSPQFVPPGTCIVLLADRAIWATVWPNFAQHAWEGAWINTLFRREGGDVVASEMIRQAVAHTRWCWPNVPAQGMVTFIDPAKVRHKRDPGRCYLRAGFRKVGTTKIHELVVLQLLPGDMPEPAEPYGAQRALDFGGVA